MIEPFLTQTDLDPQLKPILSALTQAQQIAEHAAKVSGAAMETAARLEAENRRLSAAVTELQARTLGQVIFGGVLNKPDAAPFASIEEVATQLTKERCAEGVGGTATNGE